MATHLGLHGFPDRDELEAILKYADFPGACDSAVAIQGEDAPIISIRLSGTQNPGQFECQAVLMSGATFTCHPEADSQSGRDYPTVEDLAKLLLERLPLHTEIKNAERVFINFMVGDDGDACSVTPWEWKRPLTDFLPAVQEAA
mmetsp:Transcript_53232/g.113750  ORF Transcript_53232/g.113750 Transcript_53232/m.113750 type:complete len:144 (+) Transcript_53232:290-721(+)